MSAVAPSSSVAPQRRPNRRAHTLLNIEAGGFRCVAGVGLETIRHTLMRNGAGRASGPIGVLLDLLTAEVREAGAMILLVPIIGLLGSKIGGRTFCASGRS
jgi:hypothetical protein